MIVTSIITYLAILAVITIFSILIFLKKKPYRWAVSIICALAWLPVFPVLLIALFFGLLDADFPADDQCLGPSVHHEDREISDALLEGNPNVCSQIQKITLFLLPTHNISRHLSNRWRCDYIGFPQVNLIDNETKQLVEALRTVHSVRGAYTSDLKKSLSKAETEDINRRIKLHDNYDRADQWVDRNDGFQGALRFELKNGKLGLLYVWMDTTNTYFEADYNKPALFGNLPYKFQPLIDASRRARIDPVPILYPELTDKEADAKAEMDIGGGAKEAYRSCKQYLLSAKELSVFGNNISIRPAIAYNRYSSWMDQTAEFTFRVRGENGEGAAIVQWANKSVGPAEYVFHGKIQRLSER